MSSKEIEEIEERTRMNEVVWGNRPVKILTQIETRLLLSRIRELESCKEEATRRVIETAKRARDAEASLKLFQQEHAEAVNALPDDWQADETIADVIIRLKDNCAITESSLKLCASMLAKQTDLAREAETRAMKVEGAKKRLIEGIEKAINALVVWDEVRCEKILAEALKDAIAKEEKG